MKLLSILLLSAALVNHLAYALDASERAALFKLSQKEISTPQQSNIAFTTQTAEPINNSTAPMAKRDHDPNNALLLTPEILEKKRQNDLLKYYTRERK